MYSNRLSCVLITSYQYGETKTTRELKPTTTTAVEPHKKQFRTTHISGLEFRADVLHDKEGFGSTDGNGGLGNISSISFPHTHRSAFPLSTFPASEKSPIHTNIEREVWHATTASQPQQLHSTSIAPRIRKSLLSSERKIPIFGRSRYILIHTRGFRRRPGRPPVAGLRDGQNFNSVVAKDGGQTQRQE